MKNLFLILFLIPVVAFSQTVATPSNANSIPKSDESPVLQFKEETWDFGNIPQGIPVTHVFEFSNSGKQPLIVSQATASCGCTTPVWTKEPVLTGKSGSISVTYNSAKEGSFVKTVTVLSHTGDPEYLTIKGNVIPKDSDSSKTPDK